MRELTYVEAAREALAEEMARDERIFVVGEGIGARGGNFNTTAGLYDLYGPERLRDTPISERGFVGLCTGAAMTGTRPVVDFMFVDFILDAMGEMINQMTKMQYMSSGRLKMPIVLRGCIGVGGATATHHSGSYYSIFAHLPGFRVVLPTNPYDAKGLLKTALRGDDPVLFLEHKSLLNTRGEVPEGEYLIPFGEASICRQGSDLTVVALTSMVRQALDVSEKLAPEGVSVEVIDPRTVAPLDMDTIVASVRRTGRLLVVDETFGPCGIGAEIAAQITEHAWDILKKPPLRIGAPFVPLPYSEPMERFVIPQASDIMQQVKRHLD